MVGNVNDFPSKGGFSETMSPDTIILGKRIPEYNKNRTAFVSYALVYIVTKTFMKIRIVPDIALMYSNQYGVN